MDTGIGEVIIGTVYWDCGRTGGIKSMTMVLYELRLRYVAKTEVGPRKTETRIAEAKFFIYLLGFNASATARVISRR